MTRYSYLLLSILLCLGLAACQTNPPEKTAMTFMAGFRPQANLPFVGVYVAQEKGFFADEGLDVTLSTRPAAGSICNC